MTELPPKPLPEIPDLTQPFWSAAKQGRFVMQKCDKCGTMNFHPKPWCIDCGCRDMTWTEVSPKGTVYSFTISRVVAMNFKGWEAELPVNFCLIDMDDGARLYAQVTDCAAEDMKIGMRVEAYFKDISDEAGIPVFKPI